MIRKVIPSFIFVLLLISCKNDNYFQKSETISQPGWALNQIISFNDSLNSNAPEKLHLEINIRHTNIYPYQNIWLFVQTKGSDGSVRKDSVNWTLSEPNGRWLGAGWGSFYDVSYQLKDIVIHKTKGKKRWFSIEIQHGLRDEHIEGIETVGVRLY